MKTEERSPGRVSWEVELGCGQKRRLPPTLKLSLPTWSHQAEDCQNHLLKKQNGSVYERVCAHEHGMHVCVHEFVYVFSGSWFLNNHNSNNVDALLE